MYYYTMFRGVSIVKVITFYQVHSHFSYFYCVSNKTIKLFNMQWYILTSTSKPMAFKNYILVIKGRIKLQKDICTWRTIDEEEKNLLSNFFCPCSVNISQIYMYKATNPKKGQVFILSKRINLLHIVPCLLCTNYLVLKDCLRVFKWMHHLKPQNLERIQPKRDRKTNT